MNDPDTRFLELLETIRRWQTGLAISFVALTLAVILLYLDIRSTAIRVRWFERKMDQGRILVVDKETFNQWRRHHDDKP